MKMTEGELDKLSKNLSRIRLTDAEKERMLNSIYQAEPEPIASPFSIISTFNSQRLVATFAVFMFAVVGTGYAAAGSLPGQFLYGLKVNVLEPAVLKMTFDEKKRDGYKIHLLHKRVSEMRELQLRAGINVDSEKASFYATERNVVDLEQSAVFDDMDSHPEVRADVEAYNNIISEPFRIETTLLKRVTETIEADEPIRKTLEEIKVEKTIEEVEEVVERTKTETEKTAGAVSRIVEDTVKAAGKTATEPAKKVEEMVKEVEKKTKAAPIEGTVKEVTDTVEKAVSPVTDILGL